MSIVIIFIIILDFVGIFLLRGHSITTWTRRGGEGGSQMSTIVHVREGGGHCNVHVDIFIKDIGILTTQANMCKL